MLSPLLCPKKLQLPSQKRLVSFLALFQTNQKFLLQVDFQVLWSDQVVVASQARSAEKIGYNVHSRPLMTAVLGLADFPLI